MRVASSSSSARWLSTCPTKNGLPPVSRWTATASDAASDRSESSDWMDRVHIVGLESVDLEGAALQRG